MRTFRTVASFAFMSVLAIFLISRLTPAYGADQPQAKDNPVPASQQISPEALAKELKSGQKPVIVCVGFPVLYQAAHIPGAQIEGPAHDAQGIKRLEEWAHSVSKNAPVVIYCGCCPMSHCPNIRPAYQALRRAGLTRVQVLDLEQSFASDWVNKGYPTTRIK